MQLWGARAIVMGRPAAAPQLLFMEAAAAEAYVMATLPRDASSTREVIAHMILSLRLGVLAVTGLLVSAACTEITSPPERFAIPIDGITVPSTAAPSDTVVVGFRYEASCGAREVTLRLRPDSMVVSVVAVFPPGGLVCPGIQAYAYRTVTLTPAERFQPFTVVFAQPTGADSVRTILTPPAFRDAP